MEIIVSDVQKWENMTARITDSREVTKFRIITTMFCKLVHNPKSAGISAFLAELEILLPLLCASVQFLPQIEQSKSYEKKWSLKRWQQLRGKLLNYLGKYDSYRNIYEPYNPNDNKPTAGSLSDDLADIYDDLSPGLNAWSRGDAEKRREIVDDWQIHYRIHWGYHAVSALWAIFWLNRNYNIGTGYETFEGHRPKRRKKKTKRNKQL